LRKSKLGNLAIIALLALNVAVWLAFPPENDGRPQFMRQYAGEVIGANNIILMACSLFLSTRPKWVEKYFGGLDKMYVTHRHTGTAALLLIFVHVLTVPITTTGWKLGNYLAVVAFTGIVSIVLVTLAPRIPFLSKLTGEDYDDWKKLKRWIGVFFILAFIHSLTIPSALHALVAITWTQIFFLIGLASYLYTEVFGRFFGLRLPYRVEAIAHPNPSSTEVTLRAQKQAMKKQRAGQFLFVRFPGEKRLNHAHPFTISSAPREQALRLTIKATGDFTRELHAGLQTGAQAMVEGPYGMFDYKTGGRRQVWIAGGIGITPFLAFLRDMDGSPAHEIDLFYAVRNPDEAVFLDEIETIQGRNSGLRLHVRYTAKEGPLRIEQIVEKVGGEVSDQDIYMCGPPGMMKAFEAKLLERRVPKQQIHFEEFSLR
jgi:predicted ferric reductase